MERRAFLMAMTGVVLATPAAAQELGFPIVGPLLGDGFLAGGDINEFRSMDLMDGEYATATSQIALRRSRSRAVRQFAHWEIAEQTMIAKAFGAVPGSAPVRPDQSALISQLSALNGPAFDQQYVIGQLAGHQELLALNTAYLQSGMDAQGRQIATMALPIIQKHLAILERLHTQMAA